MGTVIASQLWTIIALETAGAYRKSILEVQALGGLLFPGVINHELHHHLLTVNMLN